jgi:hypothetical protein
MMGMLCLDCDKFIKLQTKQMIELEIKRNLASETKQHMKRKSIKKIMHVVLLEMFLENVLAVGRKDTKPL